MKNAAMKTTASCATSPAWSSVVLAALALPGVFASSVHAQTTDSKAAAVSVTPEEQGLVALKYSRYKDAQPGLQRITVSSPSLYVYAPLGTSWSAQGSLVLDNVSGASPRWQSNISSASVMSDQRKAGDLKVTRYFDRSSYAVGLSRSSEHDYTSNALGIEGTWATEDNNRSYNAGLGLACDNINPTQGGVLRVHDKSKKTNELMLGVTQNLSSTDIAQLNLTLSHSKGYLSDPYKAFDLRPDKRNQIALLGRWNHHFEDSSSTLRTSYRYYHDSYRINAHTLQLEWVKPLTTGLTLSPTLRYYSQNSASFYTDAQTDSAGYPIFPNLAIGQPNSGDHRLSAFGALTLGLKAQYQITRRWNIDGKLERYAQRASLRVIGSGSSGLAPFNATTLQLGTSHRF
jgi:hypothetical protein